MRLHIFLDMRSVYIEKHAHTHIYIYCIYTYDICIYNTATRYLHLPTLKKPSDPAGRAPERRHRLLPRLPPAARCPWGVASNACDGGGGCHSARLGAAVRLLHGAPGIGEREPRNKDKNGLSMVK